MFGMFTSAKHDWKYLKKFSFTSDINSTSIVNFIQFSVYYIFYVFLHDFMQYMTWRHKSM